MKTCVSTYSYGSYLVQDRMGVLGCIEHAAKEGFDGIEFVEGKWQEDPEMPKKIRKKCEEVGIVPVAFLVGADFAARGRDEIERVCRLVDTAAEMGASMLRHDVTRGLPFDIKQGRSFESLLPDLAQSILAVTKYAEQKGIRTMSENHGFFVQDSCRMEKLVEAVSHPNYGLLLDIGNFLCVDEKPALAVGRLAPYAVHVHAKDFFVKSGSEADPGQGWFRSRGGNYLRGTIIGHGDAGAAQCIGILKRSGYNGYVTVEFEGMEDSLQGIDLGKKNLLRYMDTI